MFGLKPPALLHLLCRPSQQVQSWPARGSGSRGDSRRPDTQRRWQRLRTQCEQSARRAKQEERERWLVSRVGPRCQGHACPDTGSWHRSPKGTVTRVPAPGSRRRGRGATRVLVQSGPRGQRSKAPSPSSAPLTGLCTILPAPREWALDRGWAPSGGSHAEGF